MYEDKLRLDVPSVLLTSGCSLFILKSGLPLHRWVVHVGSNQVYWTLTTADRPTCTCYWGMYLPTNFSKCVCIFTWNTIYIGHLRVWMFCKWYESKLWTFSGKTTAHTQYRPPPGISNGPWSWLRWPYFCVGLTARTKWHCIFCGQSPPPPNLTSRSGCCSIITMATIISSMLKITRDLKSFPETGLQFCSFLGWSLGSILLQPTMTM